MKTFTRIAIPLLSLLYVGVHAQQSTAFTVIKASGKIYSALLNREVKTGDVIKQTDQLSFNNKSSYLHVVSPQAGQKTIRQVDDNSPRELMQLLEKFHAQDKASLKSRSAGKSLDLLRQELSQDTVLILGDGVFKIDTAEFSLRKPSGVKVIYQMDGKKIEKIISSKNEFALGKEILFGASAGSRNPKVSVYHCENVADMVFTPVTFIGGFSPMYVDEDLVKAEVKSIIKSFTQTPSHAYPEIVKYLSSEYAPPVEENLKNWMSANRLKN